MTSGPGYIFCRALLFVGWMAVLSAPHACAAADAESSSASTKPDDFVRIVHGHFQLHGKPFVFRGTNYFGSWREKTTISAGPDTEHQTVWAFYHNWDPVQVDLDFKFLRSQMNATVVRIGTPNQFDFDSLVRFHDYLPWFNPDGTITDRYRQELIQLADIAYKNHVRIQFCLLWNFASEIVKDRDAFKPGGKMDTFYANQVRSIVMALRDHPGVIAYSIGNEVLVKWEINGTHPSWFEGRAGGFMLRRLREVRALAPHQLLTADEGASHATIPSWHAAGAELALLPDVDNSNGGHPFRLIDTIDYHGDHFYPETLALEDLKAGGVQAKLDDAVVQLKTYLQGTRADGKPVVLDEFGLQTKPEVVVTAAYAPMRDELFRRIVATGQSMGLQGGLPWLSLPMLVLRPGEYSVVINHTLYSKKPLALEMKKPGGGLETIFFADPHYALFDWRKTGDEPIASPAAHAVASAWPDVPLP